MKPIVGGFCVALAALGGCALGGCASSPSQATAPAAQRSDPPAAGAAAPAAPTPAAAANATTTADAGAPGRTLAMSAAPNLDDQIIAEVNGKQITMGEFLTPLIDAHGLTMLLAVVQSEMAKQALEEKHLSITPQDVAAERERTLAKMFEEYDTTMDEKIAKAEKRAQAATTRPAQTNPSATTRPGESPKELAEEVDRLKKEKDDAHRQLLEQFFTQQRITPAEFDLLMLTNACLRKFVEPLAAGRITEAMIEKEFNGRFGETVRVRHIQLSRPQDRWEAQRRLQAGEPFAKVAQEMSTNRETAALGGQLPPFSMLDARLPENFKKAAFALQPGEIAMVDADNAYHLIKMEERIKPKAVKLDDQREIIRRDLNEAYMQALMRELRDKIGQIVREKLKIENPTMERQFKQRLALLQAQTDSNQQAMAKMKEEHRLAQEEQAALERAAAARAATQPGGAPAATQPGHLPPGGPTEPGLLPGSPAPTTLPIPIHPSTQPSSRHPAPGTIEATMHALTQPALPPVPLRPMTGPAHAPAPHAPQAPSGVAPPAPATAPAGAATQPAGSPAHGR